MSGQLATIGTRCVLCRIVLNDPAQVIAGICDDCTKRPEAKRVNGNGQAKAATAAKGTPRAFTAADKALIRSMHGMLAPGELLALLNRRMVADLGDVPRYSLEGLHVEIAAIPTKPESSGDWAGLRRILAEARRAGVLASITPQVVADFAAVFQLSPAQLMHALDVIKNAQENR